MDEEQINVEKTTIMKCGTLEGQGTLKSATEWHGT